jgi:hypothetical protein
MMTRIAPLFLMLAITGIFIPEASAEEIPERYKPENENWNLTEATVVAVNRDFGIVIINIGLDRGVTAEMKPFVLRGKKRVPGSFKIVTIEAEATVLEYVPSATAPDVRIQLRDRMYFEALESDDE